MTSFVIDGRFLGSPPTGLHRVARSLLVASRDAGLTAPVWAPADVTDPLVDRSIRMPGGRAAGRVWEQAVLPTLARGRTVISLTNTAPLAAPGVVLVHDLAPLIGPEWFTSSMRSYAATVVAGARRARLVLTVSDAVAGELRAIGVDPRRIIVVPPAVDPDFVPARADTVAAVIARHGVRHPYAVMVGWSDRRKDLATALVAHRQVRDEVPHELVLIGTGHPTFATSQTPRDESVRVVGRVEDGELVALLSGAEVLLYPSRYEGFGLPPLEAIACGTPAIVSDIPALRESAGGSARFEPVGDVRAWAGALKAGLHGRIRCRSGPARSWAATGQRLVDALSDLPPR